MQAKIENLKAKNSNDEEYIVYPRTLIKCVTNENGDNLQDLISDTILEADGRVYVDYGSHEETDEYVPVNADTLDGQEASYYATAKSVSDITDGTTVVGEATKATFDGEGNKITETYLKTTGTATDSAKLGGKAANEYALLTALAFGVSGSKSLGSVTSLDELDNYYGVNGYVNVEISGDYQKVIVISGVHNTIQISLSVYSKILKFRWNYYSGDGKMLWSDWSTPATTADLANKLDKNSDGSVGTSAVTLTLKGDAEATLIRLRDNTGANLGALGVKGGANKLIFRTNANDDRTILHSGNFTDYTTDIHSVKAVTFPGTSGWYRIAQHTTPYISNSYRGDSGNSCDLILKRMWNDNASEVYRIQLDSCYGTQRFTSTGVSHAKAFKKVRYTYDATNRTAYIELYYSGGTNNCYIELTHTKDMHGIWEVIAPTLTEETVDGITVTTTYDIPANAQLLTTGNKPTGTYTGSGTNSHRVIATGGLADRAVIIRNNAKKGFALVTPAGAWLCSTDKTDFTELVWLSENQIHMSTNDTLVNGISTDVFTYWVL